MLRIPGFLNRKYNPASKVTVEYPDDSIWTPDDFRLDAIKMDTPLSAQPIPSRKPPSKHSNSENDWAWVCGQLAHGKDAAKLTRELASRRSDKPNPLYYAQRTVDVASARLWLLEGIRIDDVITMLESRRRFEIPAALCSCSCAGDCGHGAAHDCPQKDRLIPLPKENTMPLLEVVQTRHLSASIRLTDTTAAQVDQYAAFIHASADEVVEQALAYVFSKDRDFQEFLKSAEAQKITPDIARASSTCFRSRRAATEEACKWCCQRQHFAASVAGSRA